MTALMYAVLQRDESLVQLLLQSGANPDVSLPSNHPSVPGWTALHLSASTDNAVITEVYHVTIYLLHPVQSE